ncbi:MAG: O-antigen ligase family protein [Candidatus Korobacteraceae bacterium]
MVHLETQAQATTRYSSSPVANFLSLAIFFFFGLFAILLPWSIKGARYAWLAAFCIWLVSLIVERKRLRPQPLALPLLAYIVLSGISCALSYEPYMSWPHMKLVCWTALIATLFAQSLGRLSQVRTLILLLLLSATAVAGFTAWQYLRGMGLKIAFIGPGTPLYDAGLRPEDTIVAIHGQSIHTPNDIIHAVAGISPDSTIPVRFMRGSPVRYKETFARAGDFAANGQVTPTVLLVKSTPYRAAGTLGHYGKLAEVFAPLACLAWALMLGTPARKRWRQILFAVMFLAITATVFATQTRSALSGVLVGCMIALFLMSARRVRLWFISALAILAVAAVLWIQHTRGLKWVDVRDPGTQYRLLMWNDGVRLARQHPLFGVGMDSIQNRWPEWNLQGFARFQKFWNFHSDLVQLAAERGFLTLAAWLWFVVAYVIYLLRLLPRLRLRTHFGFAVATGIFTGFVAFLLTSLVESSLGDDTLVMLVFFCVGVAIAMEHMLNVRGAIDVS